MADPLLFGTIDERPATGRPGDSFYVTFPAAARGLYVWGDAGGWANEGANGGSQTSVAAATGVVATDTAAITAAFAAAVSSNTGTVVFPPGTYKINQAFEIPASVQRIQLSAGARVLQTVDANIFTRTGSWGTTENLSASITQGARSATVADGTVYAVAQWVILSGGNVVPNSADKFGYLRRIVDVTGNVLTFDATTPRTISTTPRVTPVTLAASVEIVGRGTIGYQTPASNFTEAVHFIFVDHPIFTATVLDGGDDGVRFSHCVGGLFDGHCENLLDDNTTHFGYGVDVSGATRGLVVRGSATRVRHAVTTLAGPELVGLGPVGEPENCLFAIHAYNTSNKGVDTHRPGWGIIIEPNVQGCPSGGVQIRADATVVKPGLISGCSGAGINVEAGIVVRPVISSPTILWQRTAGPAIYCQSDAIITDPWVRGFVGNAIETVSGVAVSLRGGEIDGLSGLGTTGIQLAGSGSRIEGVRVRNCALGVNEAAGATDNDWSDVEFFSCTTNETRNSVYTQRKLATRGQAISAAPTKSGYWISPAAVSLTTGAHGAAGTITFSPIDIPNGVTLAKAAAEITTLAASSLLRLGIYHSDANGLPGLLLAEAGTIDGGTVGTAEVAFSSPPTVRGGRYWLAALSEVGNPSARKQQVLAMHGSSSADVLPNIRGCFFATGVTTGSLPSAAPSVTGTSTATRVAVSVS